jgi:hypothetical protein
MLLLSYYLYSAELESEGCARYYTSFRGTGNVGFSFFRKGKMFCNMSGFGVVSFLLFTI